MKLFHEMNSNFMLLIHISLLIGETAPTIDTNLAEFQYLADHLTERECCRLVAALHFSTFELPKAIDAAERRLPEGVNCLDLLLEWNSTPKEGKGQTHVEITHRLNQINREDLAQWLSKSVFHEISNDLKSVLNVSKTTETTRVPNVTEAYEDEVIEDEVTWSRVDSLISILIVFGVASLIGGAAFLCGFWCCNVGNSAKDGYKKLPSMEN